VEYNNVFFLAPNGVGNGTYGNPMPLSQTSFDAINSQSPNSARLYMQGGSGAVYDVNTSNTGTYIDPVQNVTAYGLLLYNGQDLYGRSANYTAPAKSDGRPIVSIDGNAAVQGVNGFIIQSGENTFSDLAITASTTNTTTYPTYGIGAIMSSGATADATVNVINTSVTSLNTGFYAGNDSTTKSLTINTSNSSFNSNTNTLTTNNNNLAGANGLYATNNSSGNLTINATGTSFSDNTNSGVFAGGYNTANGLYATNKSSGNLTINATDSSFNNNTNTENNGTGAFGLKFFNNAGTGTQNINVINSQFNNNTGIGTNNAGGYGLYVECSTCSAGNLNINGSSFNGNTGSGDQNGGAAGIFGNFVNMNVNITDSTFNNNINNGTPASSTGAFGIEFLVGNNTDNTTININNSQFNGNSNINVGAGNPAGGFLVQYSNIGSASLAVNVVGSQFNNNAASGDSNSGAIGFYVDNGSAAPVTVTVSRSEFNGNTANGNNNGGAVGLLLENDSSGALTFSATESQFSGNIVSGSGVNAIGYGFYVNNNNNDMTTGSLSVLSLAGSTFSNNGTYGIYAIGNTTAPTMINLADTIFFGNPINYDSSGNVTFTN
jgi:hypothetical protein